MDIKTKPFIKLIITMGLSFLWIIMLLWTGHAYIPMNFYKELFSIITIIFSISVSFFILICIFILFVYKKEKVFILSPKFGLVLLRKVYPFVSAMTRFYHYDKNSIKKFFICINNIFVNELKIKEASSDILILAPHCLQNYNCSIKVTSDPMICKECGKCKISELKKLHKQYRCKLAIATGGTLARKKVKEFNPKVIIAIACERDLISGILDITTIPVYGLLNERPNGPCINTTVNIKKVEKQIKKYSDVT